MSVQLKTDRQFLLLAGLLWLAGASLRLTLLALPPVIPDIHRDLKLIATEIGVLSSLPIVLFALAAAPAALLIGRIGAMKTLTTGMAVVAVGGALRLFGWNVWLLYGATIVMGLGVAMLQPTLPVIVREWLPGKVGLATAIYSNGLLMGEVIPVWLMLPVVMPLAGHEWRYALAFWSLPVVGTAVLLALFGPRSAVPRNREGVGPSGQWPNFKDPLIWQLGLLFGSVNSLYFATNTFLPDYLTAVGRPGVISSVLTALNLGQIPASLLALAYAHKLERRARPFVAAGALALVNTIALPFTEGVWTISCAALIGFAAAFALVQGLTLPVFLAAPDKVGRTSAGMFTISYTIAVVMAVSCGVLWDLTGIASSTFWPIVASAIVLAWSGLWLGRRQKLAW